MIPSSLSPALRRFEAVPLDALVAEAELLTRVDRKYLLPAASAEPVLASLDPRTRSLEIDGERSFAYESRYFDTPERLSYRQAAHPRRRRFKVRTRGYLQSGTAYLEVKTRGSRGATVKERVACDPRATGALDGPALAYAAEAIAGIGLDRGIAARLRPAVATRYRRGTLLLADGGRATVDERLEWIDPDGRALSLPGHVIVETKSTGGASALDRALWRAGHRPQSISKFATGTAALHPELPANRWARLLRGPFASAVVARQ